MKTVAAMTPAVNELTGGADPRMPEYARWGVS